MSRGILGSFRSLLDGTCVILCMNPDGYPPFF